MPSSATGMPDGLGRGGTLAQMSHAASITIDDLEVAQTDGEAGTHEQDRLMEEQQVDTEEDPRQERPEPNPPGSRPQEMRSSRRASHQTMGSAYSAAKDRRCARRRLGQRVEDGRERECRWRRRPQPSADSGRNAGMVRPRRFGRVSSASGTPGRARCGQRRLPRSPFADSRGCGSRSGR